MRRLSINTPESNMPDPQSHELGSGYTAFMQHSMGTEPVAPQQDGRPHRDPRPVSARTRQQFLCVFPFFFTRCVHTVFVFTLRVFLRLFGRCSTAGRFARRRTCKSSLCGVFFCVLLILCVPPVSGGGIDILLDLKSLVERDGVCALPGCPMKFDRLFSMVHRAMSRGYIKDHVGHYVLNGFTSGFDLGVRLVLRGRTCAVSHLCAKDERFILSCLNFLFRKI